MWHFCRRRLVDFAVSWFLWLQIAAWANARNVKLGVFFDNHFRRILKLNILDCKCANHECAAATRCACDAYVVWRQCCAMISPSKTTKNRPKTPLFALQTAPFGVAKRAVSHPETARFALRYVPFCIPKGLRGHSDMAFLPFRFLFRCFLPS